MQDKIDMSCKKFCRTHELLIKTNIGKYANHLREECKTKVPNNKLYCKTF